MVFGILSLTLQPVVATSLENGFVSGVIEVKTFLHKHSHLCHQRICCVLQLGRLNKNNLILFA